MKLIRGFTLIELMITIAVMAIIASIAAPSFSSMFERQRLNQNTQNLLLQFSKARSQAVAIRTEVTVNLNSQTKDTADILNWVPSNNNQLKSPSLTRVIFNSSGVTDLPADTNFSICNSKLGVTQNFTLTRFGTVVLTANGVC
ncbi:prepilin-type N-terminal cleavage/methylation domain-containing protein [Acinetobacter sp. B5B]|uniref:pilus assembly FimT family protein n=1 Tax=Acinetobacter baretiae TaxID=2605383 RepID=UPI0018C23AB3|nr:prepilin-type N-terminal cleavage/methylation domain-containing protein [Acinetobacter baretiae]MBF7682815.1 prepilin-type N-terminal cleavage/methylation domain-containing protein [Acinetobacter baretiae]MBF7686181.1 prepilin-type N-terminal cleavage/methylation domain-containing protein [Acinetobacter baretiae]